MACVALRRGMAAGQAGLACLLGRHGRGHDVRLSASHALLPVGLSLALMHGFVFAAVGFVGGSEVSSQDPWWSAFVWMTLPGYVVALSVSLDRRASSACDR